MEAWTTDRNPAILTTNKTLLLPEVERQCYSPVCCLSDSKVGSSLSDEKFNWYLYLFVYLRFLGSIGHVTSSCDFVFFYKSFNYIIIYFLQFAIKLLLSNNAIGIHIGYWSKSHVIGKIWNIWGKIA